MNNHWIRTTRFLILYLTIALAVSACNKDSAHRQDKEDTYAKFLDTKVMAKADQDSISVGVRWSLTKWQLSTTTDGFITGFSVTTGGRGDQKTILSDVYVRLKANLTGQSRSQDIIIENIATGKEDKMTITQLPLSENNRITIHPNIKYQKITGFGGMINSSWTGNTQLTEEDVDKLFGPDGLGLNIGRLMLYPNSSDWNREVNIAKRAQKHGAILFASPWTPPPSLKSANTNSNQNSEYLLPENYGAFAAHLRSYVDYYKNQGIDIYAVSVQNEPDMKVGYDGCSYSPQQMFDFVKEQGKNVGTKLIVGETVQFNKAYTDAILNDGEAVNNFDIVATHLYGFDFKTKEADYPLARQHNKEVWMTEHLFNETSGGYDWLWAPSLKSTLAVEIHNCMISNFNAYIYWYLKRYYGFIGENPDVDSPADYYVDADGEITKRGYIISHYAKYATGRTRVNIELGDNILSDDFLATAYAGNGEITVVLINKSEKSKIVDFVIPSDITSATAVETTRDKNMSAIDNVIGSDKKSLQLQVSAESIVSVRMKI